MSSVATGVRGWPGQAPALGVVCRGDTVNPLCLLCSGGSSTQPSSAFPVPAAGPSYAMQSTPGTENTTSRALAPATQPPAPGGGVPVGYGCSQPHASQDSASSSRPPGPVPVATAASTHQVLQRHFMQQDFSSFFTCMSVFLLVCLSVTCVQHPQRPKEGVSPWSWGHRQS